MVPTEAGSATTPDLGRVALALSGGGSRAIAFHLGCLRALHSVGLLERIATISAVSGGSVIASLYCSHPGDFDAFERRVREILKAGFVRPAIITALTTTEGIAASITFLALLADRTLALVARVALWPFKGSLSRWTWLRTCPFVRQASRTTILSRTFGRLFEHRGLVDLRTDRPRLIVVACELRAKAAFYFTAERLHCWRYGSASSNGVELAEAVAASAAYPIALPAVDRWMQFEKNGEKTRHRVTLTDGGVYDNLGLAPLWPDRDPTISLDVGIHDRIIACRAGDALDVADPASTAYPRMKAAFESVFARAQNQSMKRLYDLLDAGRLKGFLLPYLGQQDDKLAFPPADLVRRASVVGYPTNFSAMAPEWIDRLSRRGEQLVMAVLEERWPELVRPPLPSSSDRPGPRPDLSAPGSTEATADAR
jgi:NTE family protein